MQLPLLLQSLALLPPPPPPLKDGERAGKREDRLGGMLASTTQSIYRAFVRDLVIRSERKS